MSARTALRQINSRHPPNLLSCKLRLNGRERRLFFYCRNPSSALFSFNFSSAASTEIAKHPRTYQFHNVATGIASLQSCADRNDLRTGEQVHAYMVRNGFLDLSPLAVTSLINMYAKCNQMRLAVSVFDNYDYNVFGFNAIISGFVANGFPLDGIGIYKEMRAANVAPDRFTFPCLIKGCCDVMDFFEVKNIHGLVFKLGLDSDVFVGSALMNCFLKFSLVEDAQKVFDELPERDDVVIWNALVNGYAQIGRFEEALSVFRKMSEQCVVMSRYTVTGVLSAFTMTGSFDNGRAIHGIAVKIGYDSGIAVSNALIDMYGKYKCPNDAMEIFEGMDERDIFTWNSIMCVHEQCGDHDGTLALFDKMLGAGARPDLVGAGTRPDLVTITTVLPACAQLAALLHGREIHSYMIVNGFANCRSNRDINYVFLNNALMDMYAKCGDMRDARLVFDAMRNKDVASWNIMVMGYGVHGYGKEALDKFSLMCSAGFNPDEVTFVGVLSACSHAGFVSEGRSLLAQMESKYGIVPTIEHYACVIDMLGRAGKLEEAYELGVTMPIESNAVVWRALLAACRLHGNADLAEVTAQRVFELEPEHCGNYVLMSNVYVAAGKYEEVLDVRDNMRQQNVKKMPGCSWIELQKRVHAFVTGDRTHPESKSIYDGLHLLTAHVRGHGCLAEI